MNKQITKNILIAAGGTGGHLFPALAVGKYLEKNYNCKLYFIGTSYRIESKKIPELGYDFTPTPINAFPGISLKAIKWVLDFLKSQRIATNLIKDKKIDALICAGAYLSVPPGLAASSMNIPIFLMESNVNLGKANKILLNKSQKIFTSWDNTESYIPDKSKVLLTGNPIREEILNLPNKEHSLKKWNLEDRLTVLIMGGSLGAKSINNEIVNKLNELSNINANFIWQTGGKQNLEGMDLPSNLPSNILMTDFIDDMASVYSISDLIVSRSGATAVTEISATGKASILIPMRGAANNEQYLNAKYLNDANAAILINDSNISSELFPNLLELINNETRRKELSINISNIAKRNATKTIAEYIINHIK